MEKTDYGNWVPQKITLFFLFASIVSYLVTFLLNIQPVIIVLKIASLLSLGFFIYLEYVYWLLEKDDKGMQRKFWNLLIERLKWDGRGTRSDPTRTEISFVLREGHRLLGGAMVIFKAEMRKKRRD